jgi:PhnB protein
MTALQPYITFNGKCREAMGFYKDILGGELNVMEVNGSPIEAQCPASMKDHVLHSTLTTGGLAIMGSDMVGPGGFHQGNTITLSINCSSEEEINRLYNKFAEGGTILDPLKVQFWGAMFAVVQDKYGVRWMFNYQQ